MSTGIKQSMNDSGTLSAQYSLWHLRRSDGVDWYEQRQCRMNRSQSRSCLFLPLLQYNRLINFYKRFIQWLLQGILFRTVRSFIALRLLRRELTPLSLVDLLDSPHINDVCLHFSGGRTLWADSTFLRRSPYLDNLLDSPFSEGVKSTFVGPEPSVKSLDFSDSDDESAPPFNAVEKADIACISTFHHIDITSASYTTYRAVSCWIYSSQIKFGELKSFKLPLPLRLKWESTTSLFSSKKPYKPGYPPPKFRLFVNPNSFSPLEDKKPPMPLVSPKSIYRLAKFLELPELAALAFTEFKSQINKFNVRYELEGELADEYEEVRDFLVEFGRLAQVRLSA